MCLLLFFFFKQKTAYEMRISDWSSDVCSSDLASNANKPADKTAPANDDALNTARDEYTIDELARVAGTTVRNVRAYQDRGLLSPPERREIGRASCRERAWQYV